MGGISKVGKTNLLVIRGNLNVQRYRDNILVPVGRGAVGWCDGAV